MAQSAKRFAELLQEGINAIANRTSKPKGVVRDELGYAIGRQGGRSIEYWAYGDGHIPKQQTDVATLARYFVEEGRLEQSWLDAFIESAGYPENEDLIVDLFPDSHHRPSHNLPLNSTPFLGRESDLDILADLIANPDSRLITLVGTGGIGKTRLSIEAARNSHLIFKGGATFVALAPLTSVDLVASTIASTLNLRLDGRASVQSQLLNYLHLQNTLLVLDNFEHLLTFSQTKADNLENPAIALVLAILDRCPDVTLLITSRERLNILGEWVHNVDGLETPINGEDRAIEDYSAISLFLQAAQRAQSDFVTDSESQAAIVRICQLVEGMPLAIEIAAAWTPLLTCVEIVDKIEESLGFLTTTQRNLPQRHRSIYAVFEHSWALLAPDEQLSFARFSIFRGGFALEAATTIAEANSRLLISFVGKSLLSRDADGRFQIHELLRQFAAEKWAQSGVESDTQAAYHRYFVEFVAQRNANLHCGHQLLVLDEIEADIENIQIAWQGLIVEEKLADIEQVLDGLHSFYKMRSRFLEGTDEFSKASAFIKEKISSSSKVSEMGKPEPTLVLAKVQARQANLILGLRQFDVAQPLFEEALSLAQSLDLPDEIAFCRSGLGEIYAERSRYEEASELLQNSIDIYTKSNNQIGVAYALHRFALIPYRQDQFLEARQIYERGWNISKAQEHEYLRAKFRDGLGFMSIMLGDLQMARLHYESCLAHFSAMKDDYGVAMAHSGLAQCFLDGTDKDYESAINSFEAAEVILKELGYYPYGSTSRSILSALYLNKRDYENAHLHSWESLEKTIARHQLFHSSEGRFVFSMSIYTIAGLALSKEDVIGIRYSHLSQQKEYLVELLTLVIQNLGYIIRLLDIQPEDLLERLKGEMTLHAFDEASERGKQRELIATVEELLALWPISFEQ